MGLLITSNGRLHVNLGSIRGLACERTALVFDVVEVVMRDDVRPLDPVLARAARSLPRAALAPVDDRPRSAVWHGRRWRALQVPLWMDLDDQP